MSDERTATATSSAHPVGVAFAKTALVLDTVARDHKRMEKAHRRNAQQVRQALAALKRDAALAGYPIQLEGEEEQHGPDHPGTAT